MEFNVISKDKDRVILTLRKEHVAELERISKQLDLTKSQLIGQILVQVLPNLRHRAKEVRSANEKMGKYSKGKR